MISDLQFQFLNYLLNSISDLLRSEFDEEEKEKLKRTWVEVRTESTNFIYNFKKGPG